MPDAYRVAILLGHSSVRITEETLLVGDRAPGARRAWARDPVVLVESITPVAANSDASDDTKGTPEVHGKGRLVM